MKFLCHFSFIRINTPYSSSILVFEWLFLFLLITKTITDRIIVMHTFDPFVRTEHEKQNTIFNGIVELISISRARMYLVDSSKLERIIM